MGRAGWLEKWVSPSLGIVGLFGVIKILMHLWLALISVLRPLTSLELRVAVWPPSQPWSIWLERVWLAPFERWDVTYYLRIASMGYRPGEGTAQFHPLYPWLAKPLVTLGIHPLMALMVVSSAAAMLLLIVYYNYASLKLGPSGATFATLLFLVSPFAFALYVPYSEPVFLLCAVWALYSASLQRWWLVGIMAALATLTRQQGVLLVLPLAWMALSPTTRAEGWWGLPHRSEIPQHDTERRFIKVLRDGALLKRLLPLALIPLSYGGWLLYRAVRLRDLRLDTTSLHTFIYSFLISPQATKVVPVQRFIWPWQALWLAGRKLWLSPDIDVVVNLVGGLLFLVLLMLAWRNLQPGSKIYVVASTLLSFSYYTGPSHPYMGLLRHLFLGFPVFFGLAPRVRSTWSRGFMITFSCLGLFFLLMLYGLESWVP